MIRSGPAMKRWSRFSSYLLCMMLCFQPKAEGSTSDTFNIKISNTSSVIKLKWEKPDKTKNNECYRSEVQYKAHCDTEWKYAKEIQKFSFELKAPNMKKNYVFKLRTRLECVDGEWSKWSPEKYWRNKTGPCIAAKSSANIRNYLLVTVIPLTCLLFVCTLKQDRLRRFILPVIPDPKHTQERILNVEQFQCPDSLMEQCNECSIVEIEVVNKDKEQSNANNDCGLDEESSKIQPTHTHTVNQDLDLTPKTNIYLKYSAGTPEETTAPQCRHTVSGYVVI